MPDISLLPKLINASGAMNAEQKAFLLGKLSTYDEMKKAELFEILKNEQDKKHDLNERRLAEKKEYESKKGGIIRAYTERKSTESDAVELEDLEAQLQAA
jgi:hypothetical protein